MRIYSFQVAKKHNDMKIYFSNDITVTENNWAFEVYWRKEVWVGMYRWKLRDKVKWWQNERFLSYTSFQNRLVDISVVFSEICLNQYDALFFFFFFPLSLFFSRTKFNHMSNHVLQGLLFLSTKISFLKGKCFGIETNT